MQPSLWVSFVFFCGIGVILPFIFGGRSRSADRSLALPIIAMIIGGPMLLLAMGGAPRDLFLSYVKGSLLASSSDMLFAGVLMLIVVAFAVALGYVVTLAALLPIYEALGRRLLHKVRR